MTDWRKTAYELQRRVDELEEACIEAAGYIEAGESGRSYRILRRAIGAVAKHAHNNCDDTCQAKIFQQAIAHSDGSGDVT